MPALTRPALLALLWLGCAPVRTPPLPPPVSGPRLYPRGQDLYITGLPGGHARGAWLYVLAPTPLPGSTTHEPIGLVQGTAWLPGGALKVAWYCPSKLPLPPDGLPIAPLSPDTEARLGPCWGRYLPAERPERDPRGARLELTLTLGQMDGVLEQDLYEVLGEANVDPVSRAVTGFAVLGRCAVLPGTVTQDRTRCLLDRGVSPGFDLRAFARGGYVHRVTP